MIIPDDYDCIIDSSYYKIGNHGFTYIWVNDDWIRSTKERSEIEKRIRYKKTHTESTDELYKKSRAKRKAKDAKLSAGRVSCR